MDHDKEKRTSRETPPIPWIPPQEREMEIAGKFIVPPDFLSPENARVHNYSLWEQAKQQGSDHYKTGDVEPMDLYKAGGMAWDKMCSDIIKYAFRSRRLGNNPRIKIAEDLGKIKHCVQFLEALLAEEFKHDPTSNASEDLRS